MARFLFVGPPGCPRGYGFSRLDRRRGRRSVSAPSWGATAMRIPTTRLLATFFLAPLTLCLAPAPAGLAQEDRTTPVQIVALDECEPASFNLALGADFCKNVAVGYATTFTDLFAQAAGARQVPGLSKGVHYFECCIHPWMRVTVTVE